MPRLLAVTVLASKGGPSCLGTERESCECMYGEEGRGRSFYLRET